MTEIGDFIDKKLEELGNDEAVSHKYFIGLVLQNFPNLSTRVNAANRINKLLKQKKFINRFRKIQGIDKETYIIRSQQIIKG